MIVGDDDDHDRGVTMMARQWDTISAQMNSATPNWTVGVNAIITR